MAGLCGNVDVNLPWCLETMNAPLWKYGTVMLDIMFFSTTKENSQKAMVPSSWEVMHDGRYEFPDFWSFRRQRAKVLKNSWWSGCKNGETSYHQRHRKSERKNLRVFSTIIA